MDANCLLDRPAMRRNEACLLLGLIALAMLPRLWMLQRVDLLCPDGTLYVELAQAIDAGHWRDGRREVGVCTYPVLLASLHSLGLSWQMAGQWWNLLAATATVVPIYGWVRTRGGASMAALAAMLYAGHATLIEWSPEVLRDPTFWFLAASVLFLAARVRQVAGLWRTLLLLIALLLAIGTRVEGWFLVIPAAVAIATRPGTRKERAKYRVGQAINGPVCGALLLFALLSVGLVGVAVLAPHASQQGWMTRCVPLQLTAKWCGQWFEKNDRAAVPDRLSARALPEAVTPEPALVEPVLPDRPYLGITRRWVIWARGIESGLTTPLLLLLLAVAFATGPFPWRRREPRWSGSSPGSSELSGSVDLCPGVAGESLANGLVVVAVLAGMWLHLWYAGCTSERYPLTIVLLSLPWAARGVDRLACCLAARTGIGPRAALVLVMVCWSLYGWTDALTTRYDSRRERVQLGLWISDHLPGGSLVVGPEPVARLVAYYGRVRFRILPAGCSGEALRSYADARGAVAIVQPLGDPLSALPSGAFSWRHRAGGWILLGLQPDSPGGL